SPLQLVHARLENAALGFDLRRDLPQPFAEPRLDGVSTFLERLQRVVVLPLERRPRSRGPLLDPLRGSVRHRVQTFGERPLCLSREPLDREVELATQPSRRLLARRANRRVKGLRRRLGQPLHLAGNDALQLLDLPALDVSERRLDSHGRLAALAVDRLLQLGLAVAQALRHLLQRATALRRVLLEIRVRLLDDAGHQPHELFSLARDLCTLLLDLSLQPLRVLADSRLDLDGELSLPALEPSHLVGETFLEPLDVACPGGEALLDRLLRRDQLRAQLFGPRALALGDVATALGRDAALFFCELRERVGALAGEHLLELLRTLRDLGRDDRVELAAPALDLALDQPFAAADAPQRAVARGERHQCDDGGDDRDDCGCFAHGVIVGGPPPPRPRRRPPLPFRVVAHARRRPSRQASAARVARRARRLTARAARGLRPSRTRRRPRLRAEASAPRRSSRSAPGTRPTTARTPSPYGSVRRRARGCRRARAPRRPRRTRATRAPRRAQPRCRSRPRPQGSRPRRRRAPSGECRSRADGRAARRARAPTVRARGRTRPVRPRAGRCGSSVRATRRARRRRGARACTADGAR